jgi:hypothetical protein
MSTTATTEAPVTLTTEETARALSAAEKYMGDELPKYDDDGGGDEYDNWGAIEHFMMEALVEEVTETHILVTCEVARECNGDTSIGLDVTVKLGRDFRPVSHNYTECLNDEAADAAADAYTRRAEDGFPDA